MKNNILTTSAIMLALIAFGAGIGVFSARQQQSAQPPAIQGLLWPNPKVLQSFSVTDQNDDPFTLGELQNKWSFMFFGYTNCPDICPITLSVYSQLYTLFEQQKRQDEVQMIFVSVDPQRDNPEQLREYVRYFNEDFIGLGGSDEQLKGLTSQIGIAYFREKAAEDGSYLVDHSASIFLINPHGQLVAILSAPHSAESLFRKYLEIQTFLKSQNAA